MSPVAPLPSDEQERVAALHALHILDTSTEERFDRLVRFVKQKLQMPIALISLVDTNRQPRQLDEQQLQCLKRLASMVEHQIYTAVALNQKRDISV